jgi:hypothetical protein
MPKLTKSGRGKLIGWTHKIYGKCVMVGNLEGERYYWFIKQTKIDNLGTVSMIPASAIQEIPIAERRER